MKVVGQTGLTSKLRAFNLKLLNAIRRVYPMAGVNNSSKIFCIGHNKTGTTSLKKCFEDLGYKVGNQSVAESFLYDFRDRKFSKIAEYCKTAEVFQDIPFSLPYLYVYLDQIFPSSKFILTVRDSADQWYESLTRFQSQQFGNGRLPTKSVLKDSHYRWKGFPYETKGIIYNTPDNDLYNKNIMTKFYVSHNESIMEYFRFRTRDLLVINVSEQGAYKQLCDFIGKQPVYDEFPWENSSRADPK